MARHLILIGNSKYDDKKINNLKFVENDIKDLNEILVKYGDFDNIKIITNESILNTKVKLSEFQKSVRIKDQLFVYFSGHGYVNDDTNKLYFVFKETLSAHVMESSLDSSYVAEFLSHSVADVKVFILDCCHSGAIRNQFAKSTKEIIDEIKTANSKFMMNAKQTFGIMSSRESQTSLGGKERSLFTDCIINGLKSGKATNINSEFISLNDLWVYINGMYSKEKHVPQIFLNGEGIADISRNPFYKPGSESRYDYNTLKTEDVENLIKKYKDAKIKEFSDLSMIGFKANFKLEDIYIPLSMHVDKDVDSRFCLDKVSEKLINKHIMAEELISMDDKVSVVLGLPGMGKSATRSQLKRLCTRLY